MPDFPNTICTVTYNPDPDFASMCWHQYGSSEQVRERLENYLEVVKESGTTKGLSDHRGMTMLSAEDQEWVTNNFVPRLYAAGLRYSAVILPESHFARIGIQKVVSRVRPNEIDVRYFQTVQEAEQWLASL